MARANPSAPRARSQSVATGRRVSRRTLAVEDLAPFPYRQEIPVGNRPVDELVSIARRTLTDSGFYVAGIKSRRRAKPPPTPDGGPILVVGERKLRKDITDLRILEALSVVIAGGGVLGVFDALVTTAWVVAPLWIGAFGLVAVLFWYVYGRSYQSDVLVAFIKVDRSPSDSPGSPPGPTGPASVTLLTGHVRSEVRGAPSNRTRRIVHFQEAAGVVSMLAAVVRQFQAALRTPGLAPSSTKGP